MILNNNKQKPFSSSESELSKTLLAFGLQNKTLYYGLRFVITEQLHVCHDS